jgi:hypothetical protein
MSGHNDYATDAWGEVGDRHRKIKQKVVTINGHKAHRFRGAPRIVLQSLFLLCVLSMYVAMFIIVHVS